MTHVYNKPVLFFHAYRPHFCSCMNAFLFTRLLLRLSGTERKVETFRGGLWSALVVQEVLCVILRTRLSTFIVEVFCVAVTEENDAASVRWAWEKLAGKIGVLGKMWVWNQGSLGKDNLQDTCLWKKKSLVSSGSYNFVGLILRKSLIKIKYVFGKRRACD